MTVFKKAMNYLGLGPDADFDDYELGPEPARAAPANPAGRSAGRPPADPRPPRRPTVAPPRDRRRDVPSDVTVRGGPVRTLGPDPRASESGVGAVTTRAGLPGSRGAVVRPIPIPVTAKPHLVAPSSFNAAQEVADIFKGNAPVIMNLQEVDRELSRRLIDFASGLCYGLGGAMEKVATNVYLLTPSDVEVSAEDKRRLQERSNTW